MLLLLKCLFFFKTIHLLLKFSLVVLNCTRVDVSETFSANQLWFRILSGLFQRCSLPENLWGKLIQSWTALISSEAALSSADFWIIQNGNFWFIFHFLSSFNFFEVPQFRGTWLWFSAQFAKRSEQQKIVIPSSYRPKMSHKLDFFWVYCYCSSN